VGRRALIGKSEKKGGGFRPLEKSTGIEENCDSAVRNVGGTMGQRRKGGSRTGHTVGDESYGGKEASHLFERPSRRILVNPAGLRKNGTSDTRRKDKNTKGRKGSMGNRAKSRKRTYLPSWQVSRIRTRKESRLENIKAPSQDKGEEIRMKGEGVPKGRGVQKEQRTG